MHELSELLAVLNEEVRSGRPVALCAVVRTKGSTPQAPGACLLLRSNMETVGTLGGGCVEAEVCKRAYTYLQQGKSVVLDFVLDHDFGWDDGLICGGRMDVAVMSITSPNQIGRYEEAMRFVHANRPARVPLQVESEGGLVEYAINIRPAPRLLIAGGGHVGLAVAQLCRDLDFRVTAIDDREKFANARRFGEGVVCRVGKIDKVLRELAPDANTFVVIVTRGHNHDERSLAAVVDSDARYVGMIGSRRKVKLIFDDLRREGVSDELLARVHAPIGVDIHAVTVREIAISIVAELIRVRRSDHKHVVEGPTPLLRETAE